MSLFPTGEVQISNIKDLANAQCTENEREMVVIIIEVSRPQLPYPLNRSCSA